MGCELGDENVADPNIEINEVSQMAMQIYDDLVEVRAIVREAVPPDYFNIRPLGGKRIVQHCGVLCDAYEAKARVGVVHEWCLAYKLQAAARFSVRGGSIILAREWLQRMARFYEHWLQAGCSIAVIADNVELSEFTNFAVS